MTSTSRTRRSTRSTTAPSKDKEASEDITSARASMSASTSLNARTRKRVKTPTANASSSTTSSTSINDRAAPGRFTQDPTFEIVVLGSGGGPLETDCSGYLVKAAKSSWEDGVLALEGGSGLGALASILEHKTPSVLFPKLEFPKTHNTALLQAAHVFSLLACYLITHAHLDHVGSLIMLSGSVPPKNIEHTQAPNSTLRHENSPDTTPAPHDTHPRPHVYGTRKTLEQLSQAYQGGLWPELGSWVPDREGEENDAESSRKRRKKGSHLPHRGHGHTHSRSPSDNRSPSHSISPGRESMGKVNGANGPVNPSEENYNSCLIFSPLSTERVHRPLHPTLPITLLTYPVAHGCTSKHTYESSAMFVRYDPGAITQPATPSSLSAPSNRVDGGREFLFFGDVESSYRRSGEEGVDVERGKEAETLNGAIWREAAKSWKDGRLCGVFIECSYDSSRPAHLMFGHLSPPAVYHELKTLASLVIGSDGHKPLEGLKIFIIHIKDALVPHPTGKTAREIIMGELNDLEAEGQLGVQFVEAKKGDRIDGTLCMT
ncbi:hypothetical protein I317_07529 [Kwoniella heveanensis CBS 569]|nr:hypothetical protein I317_07529 [Kwoniella heveanensis CBS 569]